MKGKGRKKGWKDRLMDGKNERKEGNRVDIKRKRKRKESKDRGKG